MKKGFSNETIIPVSEEGIKLINGTPKPEYINIIVNDIINNEKLQKIKKDIGLIADNDFINKFDITNYKVLNKNWTYVLLLNKIPFKKNIPDLLNGFLYKNGDEQKFIFFDEKNSLNIYSSGKKNFTFSQNINDKKLVFCYNDENNDIKNLNSINNIEKNKNCGILLLNNNIIIVISENNIYRIEINKLQEKKFNIGN